MTEDNDQDKKEKMILVHTLTLCRNTINSVM